MCDCLESYLFVVHELKIIKDVYSKHILYTSLITVIMNIKLQHNESLLLLNSKRLPIYK